MIIDTSAMVAILRDEPDRADLIRQIETEPDRRMSAVSVLETAMVLEGRSGADAGLDLDLFLERAGVEIVAFTAEQLRIARMAFRRYGKGRHPAGLNFGDCVSYALATSLGEPLLFKGHDFTQTDVPRAMAAD